MEDSAPATNPDRTQAFVVGARHVASILERSSVTAARLVAVDVTEDVALHVLHAVRRSDNATHAFCQGDIQSIVTAGSLTFSEATARACARPDFSHLVRILATVSGSASRDGVPNIILGTSSGTQRRMRQFVQDEAGHVAVLNEHARSGIRSVRYVPSMNAIIGIRVEPDGSGSGVLWHAFLDADCRISSLHDAARWSLLAPPENRRSDFRLIGIPSSPRAGRLVVPISFENGSERVLTLDRTADGVRVTWGNLMWTHRVTVGAVPGITGMAAYRPKESGFAWKPVLPHDDAFARQLATA